jgi:type II secretory pathway component PulF
MFGSSRISTKSLAGLCRRVAISLDAGIDIRTVWEREAGRMLGFGTRGRVEAVRGAIRGGETIGEALAEAGEFFPPLVREIVAVGEQSGRLPEAFAQLADHYESLLHLRRTFMAALAWPIIELTATVFIIGFMIWVPAMIAPAGSRIDFLGVGTGTAALLRYIVFVALVAALFAAFVHAWRRALAWTRPIQRLLWRLPGIGGPMRLLALARLTWAMDLTFRTGMNARRALQLSLESSQAVHFTDQIARIDRAVAAGETLFEAFCDTGAFPPEFIDALHVGEESGKLPETMGRLSTQYRSRAQAALTTSSTVAAFLVWALIAGVIIAVIFKFYLGFYADYLRGNLPLP